MGARRPLDRLRVGPQRRQQHFPVRHGRRDVYQLTDFYTGAQGITPLSPVLSWAPKADRLAFVYFEKGKYDVYTLTNPRGLKRQPYQQTAPDSSGVLASTTAMPVDTTRSLQVPR